MAKKGSHTENDPWDHEYKKLGERIRAIRIAQGFTSAETFANERGLGRAQYGKFEKGKNLNYANLLKVLQALRVSLREFYSEGFEEPPRGSTH
ncbi:helix-turn-helix domain-containing protein [Mucilaginibacter lutimaris]|uniref:Helix-turn-helix domain-containing protein n=1 Tax=Mucilaginibacter lutimaris TaxID=931629 RepID=A0ABW2ZLZ3_9SPHI